MKINGITFPYPVLGIGDDILPVPRESSMELIESDPVDYIVKFHFDFDNPDIKKLISDKKAAYVCEVECTHTLLRKTFTSFDEHLEIRLPRNSVGEDVSLSFSITLIESVEGYFNQGFHSDYKDFTFDLDAGCLLGVFGRFRFATDLKSDRFNATSDFLNFRSYDKEITGFSFNSDKIIINMPQKDYDLFVPVRDSSSIDQFLIIAYALPAISEAIHQLYNSDCRYFNSDYKWVRALRNRVEKIVSTTNYDTYNDAFLIAQEILKDNEPNTYPYQRFLKQITDEKK